MFNFRNKMKPRIIARLDIKNNILVKGIQFDGLKKIGDPNNFALKYYKEGIDEIFLADIVASLYGRNNLINIIKEFAKNIFIPITVGGGIRNEIDAEKTLENGADKISINTAAVHNPQIIKKLSNRFGSQCVVICIEVLQTSENKWNVCTHNGSTKTDKDALEWIKEVTDLGAGEIILNSITQDGTKKGFDYKLIEQSQYICKLPLIISGGFGSIDHLKNINYKLINGICIGSALHYKKIKISQIKNFIKKNG